ncbi:hypothetical protein NADFUDRAFT_49438 [Nadsonia fulvescens var. elongata DSM 6958]|uniref:F-box domain-containing protein n=1 Tax=Nadsonia fulvescens var. elongata DSM 6958 TaxID=857566 RepID=A0A1E3PQ75_9ASCO|nr:hypothetical protein NADFUDRAFT_49438 [Nadsonia fulvescens var. elongata DSM 6958]
MIDQNDEELGHARCCTKRLKLDHNLSAYSNPNPREAKIGIQTLKTISKNSELISESSILEIGSFDDLKPTYLHNLPFETLSLIMELVAAESVADLHSLSFVSWRLREVSKHQLFSTVYIDWLKIDTIMDALESQSKYLRDSVHTLCVTKPSSKGEWSKSKKLTGLIKYCYNVKELRVTISGSSSWLKYVEAMTQLDTLTVRSSVAVANERLHQQQRRVRNIGASTPSALFIQSRIDEALLDDISASRLPQFDVDHLCNLIGLNELSLEGFDVCCTSALNDNNIGKNNTNSTSSKVTKLHMCNCTWIYPYQVEHFANNIIDLTVSYTDSYRALTYYERLKSLAQSPPSTLKRFVLDLGARSPNSQMAWQPLSHQKCTHLKLLSIKGFVLPDLSLLRRLPPTLSKLDFELALCERNRINTDLQALQQSYMRELNRPGLVLNIQAVYWPDTDTDVRSLYSQFQSAPDYQVY